MAKLVGYTEVNFHEGKVHCAMVGAKNRMVFGG
jgi:hypothetical protein